MKNVFFFVKLLTMFYTPPRSHYTYTTLDRDINTYKMYLDKAILNTIDISSGIPLN